MSIRSQKLRCYAAQFAHPRPNDRLGAYVWAETLEEAKQKVAEKFPSAVVEDIRIYYGVL